MDTRTALLDSAESAVRSRGYDGFSYADLAIDVGIRKASVHHHFPAKRDLAIALVERYTERVMERVAEVEQTYPDAANRLRAFVATYRAALDGGAKICLCASFSLASESVDPAVLAKVNAFNEVATRWLAATFALGRDDGTIAGVDEPGDDARQCLAMLIGAQLVARAARDVTQFDGAMARLATRLS